MCVPELCSACALTCVRALRMCRTSLGNKPSPTAKHSQEGVVALGLGGLGAVAVVAVAVVVSARHLKVRACGA